MYRDLWRLVETEAGLTGGAGLEAWKNCVNPPAVPVAGGAVGGGGPGAWNKRVTAAAS